MRFTDRSIAALKPRPYPYATWEDGRTGLGVRVLPSGRKTWVYLYRFDGKPRRMTVGIYPGSLKVALCRADTIADDWEETWKRRLTTKNE